MGVGNQEQKKRARERERERERGRRKKGIEWFFFSLTILLPMQQHICNTHCIKII